MKFITEHHKPRLFDQSRQQRYLAPVNLVSFNAKNHQQLCQHSPLHNLQPVEIKHIDNLRQISRLYFHRHEKTRSIQNSAGEKMSFANLINLSKVGNSGYSCKPTDHIPGPTCGSGVLWLKRQMVANNQYHRRCIMKVSQAISFHLQYHRANSKKKYH